MGLAAGVDHRAPINIAARPEDQRQLDLDQSCREPIARIDEFRSGVAALKVARPKVCAYCAVRENAICRVLGHQQLARLNRGSHQRWYSAGQLVAGVAASEDWCATVVSGVVKLSKTLADGRQQIVALLFPSDFLGRPFRKEFPYTAEAATEVQLCCYRREDLEGLLAEQPALKQLFLEQALDTIDAARDWMLLLGRKNALEKVAALLLTFLRRTSPECPGCAPPREGQVQMPLTRAEMADYLGLRLETVSRQLKQLEVLGAIQRLDPRRIVVRDIRTLAGAAGPDFEA
jgi:CRP/FNR family transcriptional regulator, anaerobic regulatory protein